MTRSNLCDVLTYSFIAYMWFIFSTKMDLQLNIILVTLLFIYYLYEIYIKRNRNLIENDETLNRDMKSMLLGKNNSILRVNCGGILLVCTIGMGLYLYKKQNQYSFSGVQTGGSNNGKRCEFSMYTFLCE